MCPFTPKSEVGLLYENGYISQGFSSVNTQHKILKNILKKLRTDLYFRGCPSSGF
jgi:hypothetical protein